MAVTIADTRAMRARSSAQAVPQQWPSSASAVPQRCPGLPRKLTLLVSIVLMDNNINNWQEVQLTHVDTSHSEVKYVITVVPCLT